jgi:hypothetical protein
VSLLLIHSEPSAHETVPLILDQAELEPASGRAFLRVGNCPKKAVQKFYVVHAPGFEIGSGGPSDFGKDILTLREEVVHIRKAFKMKDQ